jgi:hypothetical protein
VNSQSSGDNIMERREFFQKTGIVSVIAASSSAVAARSRRADSPELNANGAHKSHEAGDQHGESVDAGPLSSATVIFGSWATVPALDRFPNSSPAAANHHPVLPHVVTIKAGGSVAFMISGLHHLLVYGPGTQPEEVSSAVVINGAGSPPAPPLVNDPINRVYRGLDPGLFPRDRVEVVHFPEPGRYLAICGVLPHFISGMFGYVKVLP